jgi:hypothetical protein
MRPAHILHLSAVSHLAGVRLRSEIYRRRLPTPSLDPMLAYRQTHPSQNRNLSLASPSVSQDLPDLEPGESFLEVGPKDSQAALTCELDAHLPEPEGLSTSRISP